MTFGSELHVSIRVWSVFVSSVFTVVAVCLSVCHGVELGGEARRKTGVGV